MTLGRAMGMGHGGSPRHSPKKQKGDFAMDVDLSDLAHTANGVDASGATYPSTPGAGATPMPSLFTVEEMPPTPLEVAQGRPHVRRPRRVRLNEGLAGRCAASGQVKLLMRWRRKDDGFGEFYRPMDGGGYSSRGASFTKPPKGRQQSYESDKYIHDEAGSDGLSKDDIDRYGLGRRREGDGKVSSVDDLSRVLIAAAIPLWWEGKLTGVVVLEAAPASDDEYDDDGNPLFAYGLFELNRSQYLHSRDATKRTALGPMGRAHIRTLQATIGIMHQQQRHDGKHHGHGQSSYDDDDDRTYDESSSAQKDSEYRTPHSARGKSVPAPYRATHADLIDGMFDSLQSANTSDVWNWAFVQMSMLFGMSEHSIAMIRSLIDPIAASLKFLHEYHTNRPAIGSQKYESDDLVISSVFALTGLEERARLIKQYEDATKNTDGVSKDMTNLKRRIAHLEKSRMRHFEASQEQHKCFMESEQELIKLRHEIRQYKDMTRNLDRHQKEVDGIHSAIKQVTEKVLDIAPEPDRVEHSTSIPFSAQPVVDTESAKDAWDNRETKSTVSGLFGSVESAPPPVHVAKATGRKGRAGYRDSITAMWGKESITDLYGLTGEI